MDTATMEILWYLVVCASVVLYTILDGFDLGVGCLHLFARNDTERRVFLNAIGPIWDGNEVWLIIIGGALFAGFPAAYGAIFSSFYTLTMIFLCGIIFRAVAIEFRSKHESKRWRAVWDLMFAAGSFVIAFGAGVLLGNLIIGIPLNAEGVFIGNFWGFIKPYPLIVGLLGVSIFTLHGLLFILLKTEGELHDYMRTWIKPVMIGFVGIFILSTLSTMHVAPYMLLRFQEFWWLSVIPVIMLALIINIPFQTKKGNDGYAFISSGLVIALLFSLFGIGTFPVMLRSSLNPLEHSLTLHETAAAGNTLAVILVIAAIGVPLVLMYGYFIYRIFRGKVKLDKMSY
jgi:cytochrome d ubiquinol oxidase subunit II